MIKMKKIIIILVCFALFFGCTNPVNPATDTEFNDLKKDFGVEVGFVSDIDIMNSYIIELSILRSRSNIPLSDVIDVELSSAQSFYYLTKAFNESSQINYSKNHCQSQYYKNTLTYLDLTINHSNKEYNILDLGLLREGQLEQLKEFNSIAKELKSSLRQTC